eukprot:TRINITY_DN1143_c0_g1_i12.p1 TRINITY_DN1143_c0_g1~~TRINITY_DN1143_c0_g1_i12.p1  ORF type:complete len:233 (+),score=76.50 TRINITY_DN1143_c0_g1_i12:70-768(+)
MEPNQEPVLKEAQEVVVAESQSTDKKNDLKTNIKTAYQATAKKTEEITKVVVEKSEIVGKTITKQADDCVKIIAKDSTLKRFAKKADSATQKMCDGVGRLLAQVGQSLEVKPVTDLTCAICKANPLKGAIYKCTECPDFHVCSHCEATGLHKEHDLLKIASKPLTEEEKNEAFSRWQRWRTNASKLFFSGAARRSTRRMKRAEKMNTEEDPEVIQVEDDPAVIDIDEKGSLK